MATGNQHRRLTTILATDVVGYSRLMAEDEEETLARLNQFRGLIEDLIERHRGTPFGSAGDSLLAEFGSAVEAVRCAISIQEELAVRNAELPEIKRMLFRIGINVGDVIAENGNLFGNGVNVAARLEGIAAPGGICLSGSTFEQVKNRLSVGFEELGQRQLKNISDPVATYRVVPGTVSLKASGPNVLTVAPEQQGTVAPARHRRTLLVAAAALAVAIVAGAGLYLFLSGGPSGADDRFAQNFSTDDLTAAQIVATLSGARIQGTSTVSKQPFVITLDSGGKALLVLNRSGNLQGTVMRDTGKWWAADFRFCMQFARFGGGRRLCPRIYRTADRVTASRGDGTPLGWAIYK